MDHLQSLDNLLANVERAEPTVSREKSDLCWNGINMVRFVSREAGR